MIELKKKSLNICFLELSEEIRWDSKTSELAMVNEPSVFELLRVDCSLIESSENVTQTFSIQITERTKKA